MTQRVDAPVLSRSDTVERLAPEAIPANEAFASSFTPDGRTLFFTHVNADRTRLKVMRTRWDGARWTPPEPTVVADVARSMDPHVSTDGRALYYTSPRRRDALAIGDDGGDWDTWVVDLDADGVPVGMPRNVGAPANTARMEMYPSRTRTGALYYGVSATDTSERAVNGVWRMDPNASAARVAGPVNAAGASNPYVTPDERVLIFSSARAEGHGRGDLWLSVRGADGAWGEPRNLGPLVNGAETEFCPQLSPDGRWLLFSRIHFVNGERAGSDVYVVRASAVPALREVLARR
jgi:Tol biopolymer transport system component